MKSLHHTIWTEQFDLMSKPFTYHYSQPKEHRYSIDSIELCWKLGRIFNQRDSMSEIKLIDLCAGCGVMGFELAHWCRKIESVCFVEVQSEYEAYFSTNLSITGQPPGKFNFYGVNYNSLSQFPHLKNWADVLVCNPPYFRPESGSLGKSSFRNRCHYLLDASFAELSSAILYCMRPHAEAYLLLKNLDAQGIDQVAELKSNLGQAASAEKVGEVRGVDVIGIGKH
ncbi:MAG: hypothetical protein RJB13_472 [Pseudomonadota bacterium]